MCSYKKGRKIWINVRILGHKYVTIRFIFRWSFTPDDKSPIWEICVCYQLAIFNIGRELYKFSNVSSYKSIPTRFLPYWKFWEVQKIVITCWQVQMGIAICLSADFEDFNGGWVGGWVGRWAHLRIGSSSSSSGGLLSEPLILFLASWSKFSRHTQPGHLTPLC